MNFIIEVDGDSGTGKWRIFMPCTMMEGGKKVSRWLLGDYDEQYVRVDGVWKFKKIDFVVNCNVPSDQSWAESAIVARAERTRHARSPIPPRRRNRA